MEVIHITSEIGWRGGEIQLFNLINGLSAFGVRSTIICPPNSVLRDKLSNVDFFELPINRPYNPINWLKIRNSIPSKQNKVIHLHNPDAHTLAFLSKLPEPLVLHRRTIFPIKTNPLTIAKYKSSRIKKIICISEAIKTYTESILGQQRLITIHDGVNVSENINRKEAHLALCLELGIPASSKIVGNASALTNEKGWELFLKISKSISEDRAGVHYVVAGEGVLEQNLKKVASMLEISDKVHFLGFRPAIRQLLAGFDVLLVPSKSEGLGTVILDSFSVNTPVVASDIGGIPELVIHLKTGLLIESENKPKFVEGVLNILDQIELRDSLTKNAANHLLHFSTDSMVTKTCEVYSSVLT